MTGRTHLTVAIAAGLALSSLVTTDLRFTAAITAAAAFGGLLPDIDHPQSMISGWIPGSGLLRFGTRHRGLTHSVMFVFAVIVCWAFATNFIHIPYPIVLAVVFGVLTHDVADMLTPEGIQLFYPFSGFWRIAPRFLLRLLKWTGLEFVVWVGSLILIGYLVIK